MAAQGSTTPTATFRSTQVQNITSTIQWRIHHLRRMEIQDDSIPRFARVIIQQTTGTSRTISTSNHKRPTGTSRTRSGKLHFLLVNTCDGAASTICRQNMLGNGFETSRQLHLRYAVPLGTRSIGYLTKLLKPQLDENKFEESFATWEFQLAKYEQDNRTLLPDATNIAILLNETKGPLQQHLQLQAGNITTYAQIRSLVVEYHRAASQFVRLQAATSNDNQGPPPMDTKERTKESTTKERAVAATATTTITKEEKETTDTISR